MEMITAKYILPMTNGCPVIENGAMAVELGKIRAVGSVDDVKSRFPSAEVKENTDCVLLPGLVNAHCHLDLTALYAAQKPYENDIEPSDFAETLVRSIDFKHDAKPEELISGIQKGITRLIETGVTCVGDMTHFEGTFKLLREMGLRAVVFPEILAGQGEVAQQKFEIALALVEKYTDASHDRVRVGIGPYAPYLLSRNLLKIISQHAREASIPVMIHAAESFAEMEFFFDSQGTIATDVFPSLGWREIPPAQRKTPVEYLEGINFFDAPTIVVGGLHLSGKDFPILARHLVRVVWCPTMNAIMKHGAFPYGKFSEHGIPMGFGTDFWHSRQGFCMWDEMRAVTSSGSSPLPTHKEILRMATVGGARVLGLDHLTGTLEEGKKADYIAIDARTFSGISDKETIYEKIILNTGPQHVRGVIVNGNILR